VITVPVQTAMGGTINAILHAEKENLEEDMGKLPYKCGYLHEYGTFPLNEEIATHGDTHDTNTERI